MYPELQLGSWTLPSYFLVISIDFCLMLLWLQLRSRQKGFSPKDALDVGFFSAFVGLLGARLFYVFYEQPHYYFRNPLAVFKLWEGGFVFLPGTLFGLAAGLFVLHRRKQSLFPWLDLFAPVIGLGYSLGRWACFLQGCCYGYETQSALGIHFHSLNHQGETLTRYPTQVFASLGELGLVTLLLLLEKSQFQKWPSGILFGCWLVGHGLNRMFMEVFRDDPRGLLIRGLGVSFWIASVLVVSGFLLIILRSHRFPRQA